MDKCKRLIALGGFLAALSGFIPGDAAADPCLGCELKFGFVPEKIQQIHTADGGVTVIVDHYAVTQGGDQLWTREPDFIPLSDVVQITEDKIIGSPVDGPTCAALEVADLTCSKPIERITDNPDHYFQQGICRQAVTGVVSNPTGTSSAAADWVQCNAWADQWLDLNAATYPNLQKENPVCTNTGSTYFAGNAAWEVRANSQPFQRLAFFEIALTCEGEPFEEPEDPVVDDDEIYDAIKNVINNWWFTNITNNRIDNTTINNTSISITNNYNDTIADPIDPPDSPYDGTGVTPLPPPDMPPIDEPDDKDEEGEAVDCSDPDLAATVMCSSEEGFIDNLVGKWMDGISDLLLGDFDFAGDTTDLELPTHEHDADFVPVDLAASGACPAPPEVTVFGRVYKFENAYICDGLAMLHPLVVLLATVSAMMIVAGGFRGNA